MPTPRYNDRGDTLIEILIAVVLIGLIFSGFVIALETNSTGSTTHKNLVTADAFLRNVAEGAKSAARTQCPSSSTYTTTPPAVPAGFSVAYGTGFTASGDGVCPANTTSVQQAHVTVCLYKAPCNPSTPVGVTRSLDLDVRTP